jgi:hypothetical protein
MPLDYTSNTFSEVYKDDFSDSAGFHRILFNSGRPLQARELTQLQTILQTQIQRFADNVFLDGAAVGSSGAGVQNAAYVILENLPSGRFAKDYEGVTLVGPSSTDTSGLRFHVVHAEESTDDGDFPTLYGYYLSANQSSVSQPTQTVALTYNTAEELVDIRSLTGIPEALGGVTVRTQPGSSLITSTGSGLLFGIKKATFWTQGHFVFAPEQLIVVSKYNTTADIDVGFEVKQDIVTEDDDESLYDNQGAVPNLSSPGAHRYRIRLVLTEKGAVADPYAFVYYASIRNGELAQVKGGSESYNQVEKRMAVRHFDTHGNFIVNPFDIRYNLGDSDSVLHAVVPGNWNGNTPTAFVDGYRLTNAVDTKLVIHKPTSHTEEEGQATPIAYRNYINVAYDSAYTHLGNWTSGFNLNTQTKMALMNGSTVIGNGRIKHIVNTLDDTEGYRIHWYDVKMKDGQNARNVESFAPHNALADAIPVKLVSGQMYAVDPEINTSIHSIPGGRVKSVSNLLFTVQRQFTATSNGSSQLQITTQNNEAFDDTSRWVFINTATAAEETVVPGNISLNSATPQTATCTVSGASASYIVYAYVQKNSPQPKTKTFSKHGSSISAALSSDSAGDRFVFNLYDGVKLVEARADSAAGRLITDECSFDGGQRENYYGPVVLANVPSGVSNVHAKFQYFDWGSSGDYFAVNSYVFTDEFGYADIPTFRSVRDGQNYDMRNHLDFRSKLDPLANAMSSGDRFETPRDGDVVTYDVQWYNRRVDHISLGYNPTNFEPQIRVNKGSEDLNPVAPPKKVNEMNLFRVTYNGNTIDTKDLDVQRMRHKRFRMSDIGKLEDRVSNLEETVSLSFLEQEAANLVELDANGNVRSKTGFFVDDFKKAFTFTGSQFQASWTEDPNIQGQSLYAIENFTKNIVGPKTLRTSVQMLFDSDNVFNTRTGITQSDMVRKGDLLYVDYREVLDSTMANEVISWFSDGRSYEERGYYNVNPFNVFTGEGFLKLSPATDQWSDTYHLPDRTIIDEENREGGETQYTNRRNGNEVTPTQPPGTRVDYVETVTIRYDEITSIDEDVIAYAVPFSRQREVFGFVQGLRPETRYWPFFDGVNVEQWTIGETETEYKAHLAANDHLRGYPEVDVTIKQHPRKTGDADSILISDYKGDVYFSFWLPNNAPVPVPSGDNFTSIDEWEAWIEAQRKEAANYPAGISDPELYDDIGWKFRTGSIEFLLNDVSTNLVENGLSNARTLYISSGSLNVSQKTIHMTRVTEKVTMVYVDPLAQSFMIDGRDGVPGAFVTKVDVFMRTAPQTANRGGTDLAIPLQLQIREVDNGIPVAWPAGEQYRVYKPADEVYDVVSNISDLEDIDDVLSNPVTFEFPEPVYLQANEEYALVLMAECDDYNAFISTTYDLVLGKTEERVNAQPATGSLFLSQNGSTWTPKQDQNLAYRIYTAKFKQQGNFNLFNSKLQRHRHNASLMSIDAADTSRFRVNHVGHGLGVGDKVALTGLDSSSSYFGVSGSVIMDSNAIVDSADVAGYMVALPSGSFNGENGWFGADSATTNRGFNFDRATYNVTTQEYPFTNIEFVGNFNSGVSHSNIDQTATADPRFDFSGRNRKMLPNQELFFASPKYLGNPDQEYSEISPSNDSAPSVIIGGTFTSVTSSTFGGPSAGAVAPLGYTSDVSPILDLQRSLFVAENYLIDNQPVDSASASEVSNTPFYYVPETNPIMGSAPSKHITKPIVLSQAANGMRIFVDAFCPERASFDVYYRTVADPDEDIYEVPFVRVSEEGSVPKSPFTPETFNPDNITFSQYSYLAGGLDGDLDDFTKFQVKIVMKSTNTSEVPFIKSVRAIALI